LLDSLLQENAQILIIASLMLSALNQTVKVKQT